MFIIFKNLFNLTILMSNIQDTSEVKEQIVKNSFWNIVSSLINRLGGFIFIILISRILLPEGFGAYSLSMAISLFLITFSDMGINQTLIRYVSSEMDKNNERAVAYFKYLLKIKIFVVLFISILLLLLSFPLSFYILKKPPLFPYLAILSIYVFFISLTSFFESLFFIKKQVRYISLKEIMFQSLKLLIIPALFLLVELRLKLNLIFISFSIISIFIFFFTLYLSKKSYPQLFKKTEESIDRKEILKFIFFLNVGAISLVVLAQTTIILLGIFLSEKYVGYYSSAWSLVTGISSMLVFSQVFLPIFTKIKEKKFETVLKKAFKFFMILTIPVSFGLSFLSKEFISLIYGPDYFSASFSLSILSFIIPCVVGADLALMSFSAKGKPKEFSKLILLSAVLLLVLNYTLIRSLLNSSPELILIGVSIANLVVWLFYFIFSIFIVKKVLKINLFSFDILKSILGSLVMILFIKLVLKISGHNVSFITGILLIMFGASVYFVSIFLLKTVKKEDITTLKDLFKKKRINQDKFYPS